MAFALVIFIIYAVVQIIAFRHGLEIPCGCFGDSTKLISYQTFVIPCVAAVAALLSWLLNWQLKRDVSTPHDANISPNQPRAGLSLIELIVVIAIIGVLTGFLLSAVQKVRAAIRADCPNKLRQLALATHQYHDAKQLFPPGLSVETNRRELPYLSRQARLLPFLEQQALWTQIEGAFATDPAPMTFYGHTPHLPLMATPVEAFQCPTDPRLGQPAYRNGVLVSHTSYLGIGGLNQTQRNGAF